MPLNDPWRTSADPEAIRADVRADERAVFALNYCTYSAIHFFRSDNSPTRSDDYFSCSADDYLCWARH